MTEKIYDLIIVGGGPAGATAALYAARHGLKTLLVDKGKFPRDKICGDALSGKTVAALRDLNLLEKVRQLPGAFIQSITFGGTKPTQANIDFHKSEHKELLTGFVIRRLVFDDFLFKKAQKVADSCIEEFTVQKLIMKDGYVAGVKGKKAGSEVEVEYRGRMVLGADGFNSIVARKTGLYKHEPRHWVVALRCYYQNVGGLSDQIELHFVEEVLPGYFWIFPLEDGHANVGIGMLHEAIKRRKVNLKNALQTVVNSPRFRGRFAQAKALEEPVGWNLPVGSKHRKIYGNGFMLLGDAASLIDPFTGEGIGNAMYSARFAVETAKEACGAGDFSQDFLARYDKRLWAEIGDELKVSTRLRQLGRSRFLLNLVIGKAARNKEVHDLIYGMLINEIPKKKLTNPLFYLKLLFS